MCLFKCVMISTVMSYTRTLFRNDEHNLSLKENLFNHVISFLYLDFRSILLTSIQCI